MNCANIIFDKKTLKVVSLFDNVIRESKTDEIIKSMFPSNFSNLSLWKIDENISYNPLSLKVGLDYAGNPQVLFYLGKEIYRVQENKNKPKIVNGKALEISRDIILTKRLSDFLITSPYTKKQTAESLSAGSFPYNPPIPITLKGFFKTSTGYAAICRNVLLRLHNYGIITKPDYLPSHSDIDPVCLEYLSKYETLKFIGRKNNDTKILICTPLSGIFNNVGGRKIIFTMMETETLHPDFARGCNEYNEVWVPCNHNRNLFINGGVKVPVHVIPLGVDKRFYFEDNEASVNVADGLLPLLGNGLKKFKFISLFQWYPRKCPDILIKSFVRAFKGSDDVCLIVACHGVDGAHISNEVQKYAKSIRDSDYPSIFLYGQIPTDKQMPSVYRFCDAFISTSRGEGFSIPPIEAAACGLPVISSYHTAMLDYLNEDNSYIVPVTKREIAPSDFVTLCGWYGGQLFNKLGDDEIDQFAIHMQSVVNNYDIALSKAKKLQSMVKNNFTWDISTSLIARRIREGQ